MITVCRARSLTRLAFIELRRTKGAAGFAWAIIIFIGMPTILRRAVFGARFSRRRTVFIAKGAISATGHFKFSIV